MDYSETPIDVHAHVWLGEIDKMVQGVPAFARHLEFDRLRFGAESQEVNRRMFADRFDLLVDPGARIAEMKRTGIGIQVVSVSPTQYHNWAERPLATELAIATNELVASHCKTHPHQLVGLGVVPLQYPEGTVAALEHAVLTCGLKGIEIASNAIEPETGRVIDLSDPRLDALWQRAAELGAVVFIHPWGCTLDERLSGWYMGNSVGQPVEHAVALSHLIFSGVLDRHPTLKVIAAHGGGYLPTHISRADFAWANRADARGCLHTPSSYLRKLWFDSLVYTPAALRALVEVVGPSQVVLGTDYPFDMGVEDSYQRLEAADLGLQTTALVRSQNAASLGLLPRSVAAGA